MAPSQLRRRRHDPVVSVPGDPRFPELLLYPGSLCNRSCHFCCVEGDPSGSYRPFPEDGAARVMSLILPQARIKLYGGEPTLYHEHCIDLVARLRGLGYLGRLTVFSNGIQADRLIRILDADPPTRRHPGSDAYLNHHIWHGSGVEPLPASRRVRLEAWARAHPDRLWLGHDDVLPVGGATRTPSPGPPPKGEGAPFGGRCARCFPTLRSDGRLHACAFAVEVRSAQYDLGAVDQPTNVVAGRHARFLSWVEHVLEPAARALGESPCATCLRWAGEAGGLGQGATDRLTPLTLAVRNGPTASGAGAGAPTPPVGRP